MEQSLNRVAFSATVHCLTGCAIGEVLGMIIGTALGWGDFQTIAPATPGRGEWPQFLGPQRNGISSETGLLDKWPATGPKEVWRVTGGVGMLSK